MRPRKAPRVELKARLKLHDRNKNSCGVAGNETENGPIIVWEGGFAGIEIGLSRRYRCVFGVYTLPRRKTVNKLYWEGEERNA